ncbi:hypothetical protein SAY87_010152 [Trapa incisa]|uniref:Uncharacterized protein n=1 Tax=Trapa incisa TaxID=236973 RepID=A0AAN7GDS2_9MYRT|nr:hypothetical protein SAY87_010152 [Trapa incisa]
MVIVQSSVHMGRNWLPLISSRVVFQGLMNYYFSRFCFSNQSLMRKRNRTTNSRCAQRFCRTIALRSPTSRSRPLSYIFQPSTSKSRRSDHRISDHDLPAASSPSASLGFVCLHRRNSICSRLSLHPTTMDLRWQLHGLLLDGKRLLSALQPDDHPITNL